ncbi:MAG: AMP-binding protein [Dehalococcoidales bacterium]|nr:AMP-binding protein [Dehalococcoidales bacterium]
MAVRKDEHYDQWETMSEEARENYLASRLRLQLHHVYRNCPAARDVFDTAGVSPGDIDTIDDLSRLPVTRKEDIIRLQEKAPPYGGLVAVPEEDVERVFISPGPVYEIQSADIEWFSRALWAAGFRKGDVVINSFTYHLSPAGMLMHEGLRNCGATVVVAGTGNIEIQLRAMKQLKVNGFLGTPSFLMMLIKKAEENGEDFRKNYHLEKAWFTGEPLAPSLRLVFEDDYGIDTYQGYAVTEPGGVIAYECSEKNGFHLIDDYAVEIIDPESGKSCRTGDAGEIAVTPVHNKTWGLVRFGTGDLSRLDRAACPCGRTAPRLTGILGRTGAAIKVRGMFVVPGEVEKTINGIEAITNYQLKVSRSGTRDSIEMIVSLKAGAAEEDVIGLLARDFQARCRLKLDDIKVVPEDFFKPEYKKVDDTRSWG